jgi:hypothetical protein
MELPEKRRRWLLWKQWQDVRTEFVQDHVTGTGVSGVILRVVWSERVSQSSREFCAHFL